MEEDVDEDAPIKAKRRKALEAAHDPIKLRRKRIRLYYNQSMLFTTINIILLLMDSLFR